MKIAIICVCYNAYEHLLKYAVSLHESLTKSTGVDFSFLVVDNSTQPVNQEILSSLRAMFPDFVYLKSDNVGYFPAFKKGVELLPSVRDYDFVAVSNVDLTVDLGFFDSIKKVASLLPGEVGIIAPSILSQGRGGDLNPKTIGRPSRFSLLKNIFIFKHLWLFKFYRKLSDLKVKSNVNALREGANFYSPHGSFVLFTRNYFSAGGSVDYPQFLFGEEDFVAEECLRIGLNVNYQPSILIFDDDHGSTSREKLEFIASEHVKSLKYIVDTYHS